MVPIIAVWDNVAELHRKTVTIHSIRFVVFARFLVLRGSSSLNIVSKLLGDTRPGRDEPSQPTYTSDDIVAQCRKCKSPGYLSRKLFESTLQDLNNFPLTLQGDCPNCGTKIVFLQEEQAICDYCKTPQSKRGQTQCLVCGAHRRYPTPK